MRIAFLDEAGISNRSQEPHTVVAGVIVECDVDWLPLERRLQEIVSREFPEQDGAFLHAAEIYGGFGAFHRSKGWDETRRFAVLDELAAIPSQLTLPIVYGHYSRERAVERIRPDVNMIQDPTQLSHMMAAARCLMQVLRAYA